MDVKERPGQTKENSGSAALAVSICLNVLLFVVLLIVIAAIAILLKRRQVQQTKTDQQRAEKNSYENDYDVIKETEHA